MSQNESTSRLARIYKNKGKDVDEMRRRRSEVTIELRRNKRDESLLKRRNVPEYADSNTAEKATEDILNYQARLLGIVADAQSSDSKIQLSAVQSVRKLLSCDRNPPIDSLIEAGVLPILIRSLDEKDQPTLQFEAAWALTNIASGTSQQTRLVVEAGAVPLFIALLQSQCPNVCEQAVWALGNIIGDGPFLRDYCIKVGCLEPLLNFVLAEKQVPFLKNIAWVFVNLCRHNTPPASVESISMLMPAIKKLITHSDLNILMDTIWAISYITDSGDDYIQLIVESGLVPMFLDYLTHSEHKVQTAALRSMGNIATGNKEQRQVVLNYGALKYFHGLLAHPREKIVRDALWCLANILFGTIQQIQAVIDMGLIGPIVHHLSVSDFQLRKDALLATYNLCYKGSGEQARTMLDFHVVSRLCSLLDAPDSHTVLIALESLRNLLKFPNLAIEYPNIHLQIEECGGLTKIEQLQESENTEIYKLALDIIEEYFSEEAEEQLLESGQTEGNFQFGATQSHASGYQL